MHLHKINANCSSHDKVCWFIKVDSGSIKLLLYYIPDKVLNYCTIVSRTSIVCRFYHSMINPFTSDISTIAKHPSIVFNRLYKVKLLKKSISLFEAFNTLPVNQIHVQWIVLSSNNYVKLILVALVLLSIRTINPLYHCLIWGLLNVVFLSRNSKSSLLSFLLWLPPITGAGIMNLWINSFCADEYLNQPLQWSYL